MLHSFYNVIENIFKRIAAECYDRSPQGQAWHRELLDLMAQPGKNRAGGHFSVPGCTARRLSGFSPFFPAQLCIPFALGQNEVPRAGVRRDAPVGGRRAGSVFRSRDRRPIIPARPRHHRQPQRSGIRHYDKLVVICSKHSLESPPVIREIERALQKEDREHRNVLFPIRIDDYLFDEWDHPRKADVVSKVVRGLSRGKQSRDLLGGLPPFPRRAQPPPASLQNPACAAHPVAGRREGAPGPYDTADVATKILVQVQAKAPGLSATSRREFQAIHLAG